MPRFVVLTALFLCLALPAAAAPVVGFLRVDAEKYFAEEQRYNPYATRALTRNGLGFGLAEWRTMYYDTDSDRILKMLREFSVMVIDTPFDDSINVIGPTQQATAAAARQALESYLTEGGSALLNLQAVRYPGDLDQDYANLILEGLGVKTLHEGIYDAQHAFSTPIATVFQTEGFFWTGNVTPGHPVTDGVKRLCLPQYHNGQTPGVVAPQLSPEWQVLARGEASAQSYAVTREHVTDYTQVGAYPSAPPIVAVRSFGKGRVMVFSVPARSVHGNYGVPGWNMIVEATGNAAAGLPSDGAKLVLNGIKWLAETSGGNPNLGTFKTEPVARIQFPQSVEWDTGHEFAPPVKGVRGIVGLKTALSDGAGTVAEYVAAARAAGLSFIVFNESLEGLTEGELEQLKAECKAASTADFYACPGVEFSDDLGNRWATWGERVIFPQAQFNRAYGETNAQHPPLKQWDGAVMHNPGQYWEYCSYLPNMLLSYRNLRAQGGHPANMWWFYRLPPYVYDGGTLVEDQFAEWLYGLRDIRFLNPVSYTRVKSPAGVAAAARACATGARDLANVKDWLNTRCGNFYHAADPYVTSGPTVEQWSVINRQHDLPFEVRGKQRARLRFQVSSPEGIVEVKIHNADYGVFRRFLGGKKKVFAQEFNVVHDKDHALTLEVTDGKGRQAISDRIMLYSYKMSLLRCGDNLNFLNGVGLCWHPDRNEMLNLGQMYQGMPAEAIAGYDTAVPFTHQAILRLWAMDHISTEELKQYPTHDLGVLRKILDVKLPGNDVKILDMDMGPIVWSYDSQTRDTPARTSIPQVIEENKLFSRSHRAYYLQNRTNMYVTWDYRRAREGAEGYRGGVVWHEGKITFTRDATLSGGVPVMLFYFTGGALDGKLTTMVVKDAGGGPVATVIPQGEPFQKSGLIGPGGYATAYPMDLSNVFYAGAGTTYTYVCISDPATGKINQLQIGLGQPGQKVKAGQELTYRFAMLTLGQPPDKVEDYVAKLQDIGDSFGIGGGGLQPAMKVGSVAGREMFLSLKAKGHEVAFNLPPRETIIDLPIAVEGIEDNGCAAVYGTKHPWLRWVGVARGKAWLQEDVDRGSDLWIGNVFLCDNKEVKLTLVDQGQAAGKRPFLEVHNPTAKPLRAVITSPPHTPRYGGTRLAVKVPAGSTVTVPVRAR